MIYLFHGTDTNKARAKAFQWVAAARAKAPEAAYLRLSSEQISEESLANAMSAQGLFFAKSLILLDDPFADKEAGELVLASLKALAASENPIAILAPKLAASAGKKLELAAAKVFTEGPHCKEGGARIQWHAGERARRQGRPSSLEGDSLGVSPGRPRPKWCTASCTGRRATLCKKGGGKWGARGARELSLSLIELLSDSRGRDVPLSLALERFALSL